MQNLPIRILLVAFFSAVCGLTAQQAPDPKPLRDSELLALVAGNALPEDIVAQMDAGGVDFRITPEYKALLKAAGANDKVVAGVENARVSQTSRTASTAALLQHLSAAGELVNSGKGQDAIRELDAAAAGSDASPETAFVLGRILVDAEDFENALAVFDKLLERAPLFPEIHTKLSFVYYREGDNAKALRQAKMALQSMPNSAEAHKNAGLALTELERYDEAKAEYKEAMRLKSDYASPAYDLGILYTKIKDPDDAIREYRIAKQIDPSRFDIRQNLSAALIEKDVPAAIVELREMEAMFPESAICHECLGNALFSTGDLDGAEKEYNIEVKLDPTEPMAYVHVGDLAFTRQKFDDAAIQYRKAEQLDPSNYFAHAALGQIYMEQKHDLNTAIDEFKQAEALSPSSAELHDMLGAALAQAGRSKEAISEFREAVTLDPRNLGAGVSLAKALEANRDWPAALEQYRKAAIAFSQADVRKGVIMIDGKTPQQQYDEAQKRYSQYLAGLKSSGRSADAVALEKQVSASSVNPDLSKQLDNAMLAGSAAMAQQQPDEAKHQYQIAVKLGEQIQPHDDRLIRALDAFGRLNIGTDAAIAQTAFERELKLISELYGDNNPDLVANALRSLGGNAAAQKEFDSAVNFYSRALKLDQQTYGEQSMQVGNELRLISRLYEVQNHFDKAEPYLLQDLKNAEATGEQQHLQAALWGIAFFYDRWGKPQQTFDCQSRLIAMLEKQYGPNSYGLAQPLQSEEKALRALGRNGEADQVAARMKSIQAAPANSNQHP